MRLFFALPLPKEVQEALAGALEEVRPLAPRARWVDPRGTHLTLLFLGEVPAERLPGMKRALAALAPAASFPLALGGAGIFGGGRPRTLWVGVWDPEGRLAPLERALRERVREHTGWEEPDPRPFAGHVTLARSKAPRGERGFRLCVERLALRALGSWRVAEVLLIHSALSSRGPRHEPLAQVALR